MNMKGNTTEREAHTLKNRIVFTCAFVICVDSFFNASYFYQKSIETGDFAQSILYAVIIGLIYFSIVTAIALVGIRQLPTFSQDKFSTLFPLWLGLSLVPACFSLWLTVSVLGLSPAQNEYLSQATKKTNAIASSTISAVREAIALEAPLSSAISSLKVLYENETKNGSVCGQGKGLGECASTLSGLKAMAESTHKRFIESKANAQRHIRRIEDSQDKLRRLAKNKEIDFDERVVAIKKEMATMIIAIESLQRTIPISALQNAIDGFSREFSTAGIGDIGASRLNVLLHPIAQRLNDSMGDLKEVSQRSIKPIDNPSNTEILAGGIEAIYPIISIGLLMSFAPLFLCLWVIISTRDPDDDDDDDDGNYGGQNLTDIQAVRSRA